MANVLNQYSFVIVTIAVILLATVILLLRKPRWQEFLSLGVITAGLVAAWFVLHPTQTPLMADAQTVKNKIGQGQPVLLEFQSPY